MITVNVETGEIVFDATKCTGCGTCTEQCPMGVWELETRGRKKVAKIANPEFCLVCHVCETRCPDEAIKVLPPLPAL